ncbi:MAG: sulfatase-like hydrolase/transferase [Caldilineaceae bacterium]
MPARTETDRANIILIITDQERYPRHWPDGWVEENLPGHVRLAANGMTFTRHFCSATMCSPSRSTLFTGMHPAQHGVIHTLTEGGTFSPDEPTLPLGIQTMGTMLGSAGYNVVLKGKWHMSKGDDGGDPTAEQVAAYGFNGWVPTSVANDTKVSNFGGGCANLDSATAGDATDFLAGQSGAGTTDDPFCLIVGLGNPHDVLSYPNTWDQVEESGCDNYAGFDLEQGISLPATVYESLSSKPRCQRQARDFSGFKLGTIVTPEEAGNYVNFYAGLIKEVDQYISAILDAIPAEIRDNTIVVYTSDHGEMGMAHSVLRQKAFQVYEETVNVPMIVYNPVLFPEAQETDAYTALIDLMIPRLPPWPRCPTERRVHLLRPGLDAIFNAEHAGTDGDPLHVRRHLRHNPNGSLVASIGEEIPSQPEEHPRHLHPGRRRQMEIRPLRRH